MEQESITLSAALSQSASLPFFWIEAKLLPLGPDSPSAYNLPEGTGLCLDLTDLHNYQQRRDAEETWTGQLRQGALTGVRVSAFQLSTWPALRHLVRNHNLLVRLCSWQRTVDDPSIFAEARIFPEIDQIPQLSQWQNDTLPVAGWCAVGREYSGTPEAASTFVLLQALARQQKPFLVAGPARTQSSVVAACRIAGAAGVFLRQESLHQTTAQESGNTDRTLARTLYRLRVESDVFVEQAAGGIFQPESPLAKDHGTKFPIVQGPMTRVSDCPRFLQSVAAEGGLPMLAMALHPQDRSEVLLAETEALLQGRPWGVGLLGFAPQDLLQQQLALVQRFRPAFCVLSGGRPDQVKQLEAHGTRTYLHVPVSTLIKPYFARGVRRFVFEGSECGGHTGPHTSFALWAEAVDSLLALSREDLRETSVLFAGGIHDGLSAGIAAAFGAQLAMQGVKVGVLLGTAYLFTEEIVRDGAVTPAFQQEAILCRTTARLVTGPGHLIRCAETAFVQEFSTQRATWEAEGLAGKEMSRKLESLTLGRARAASRGSWRSSEDSPLEELSEAEQRRVGMYMMGEVAALRDKRIRLADLHQDIAENAVVFARKALRAHAAFELPNAEPIAIIGMSALIPGASDRNAFWQMQLSGNSPIQEIPEERFDWKLYFDPDPRARDRIYSRWGGFLDSIPFDPASFGIPPRSLGFISPMQLLGLEVARRALKDAGYGIVPGETPFDREHTSLAIGVGGGADLQHLYISRCFIPMHTAELTANTCDRLPEWTEESFPGTLVNVIAGRIANRLDLGGSNRVIDAACASSLAALQIAVTDLQTHRSNMAIAGGIDLDQTPYSYLAFSKTQALSPRGVSRPFDRSADGIVLSEGVCLFVLKRLSDAQRDGDRIYAVLRSVEGSSDGKGRSLTAPRPDGQRRALDRAYERARIAPSTIQMYEAHGTGTALGDRSELETVTKVLQDAGTQPGTCALGSLKELIGHTKAAAGSVSLMKAALALYHRVLPPLHTIEQPVDALLADTSPLTVYGSPTPWIASDTPRRAGISAFGFGGTNFHAVLEEAPATEGADGADQWNTELFVFAAETADGLLRSIQNLLPRVRQSSMSLQGLARECASSLSNQSASPLRLACTATSREDLLSALERAVTLLETDAPETHSPGFHLCDTRRRAAGRVAFLFPGQGSQYPGMAREAALYMPELRSLLALGNRLTESTHSVPLSRWMMPPRAFTEDARNRQKAELTSTDVAQPAIGIHSFGLFLGLQRLGIQPDCVAGHSYGELVALAAAGVLSTQDLIQLSIVRGEVMRKAGESHPGGMVAVRASVGRIAETLLLGQHLWIANINAPDEVVIAGSHAALEEALGQLQQAAIPCTRLRVACAFHSPLMAAAVAPLAKAIDDITFHAPTMPVYANLTGRPYSSDPSQIQATLKEHLRNPVHFEQQVRQMHADGVTTFIEVGPGQVLTRLVGRILNNAPHQAVALDENGGGLAPFFHALGFLHSIGAVWDPARLFDGRSIESDLAPQESTAEWFVNGGRVRHKNQPAGMVGAKPFLTLETAAELKQAPPAAPPPTEVSSMPIDSMDSELLRLYTEQQMTMRALVESQERIFCALLDRLDSHSASHTSSPSHRLHTPAAVTAAPPAMQPIPLVASETTPAETQPEPPQETPVTLSMKDLVVAVVSERTGFPPETLRLDDDVEADIGIDSIKRIEILLEIERLLPPQAAAALKPHINGLNQFSTLRQLIAALETHIGESTQQEATNGSCNTGTFISQHVLQTGSCPVFLMQPREKNLSPGRMPRPESFYLVTQDELGIAPLVLEQLRALNFRAELIGVETLSSSSDLRSRLSDLSSRFGRPDGVLHLASLGSASTADWQSASRIQLKSLFEIAQFCVHSFPESVAQDCVIVAATGFGGHWGREGSSNASSAAAGVHGLLRTLHFEHPSFSTSTVDLDPSAGAAEIACSVVAELLGESHDPEVGYRENRRFVFEPVEVSESTVAHPGGWQPEAGSVVVLTGGARGITARIAEEFAAPGVHLVLLGRGHVDGSEQELGTSPECRQQLRAKLIQEAQQAGAKVRPTEIEARVDEEMHRRDRIATLQRLRNLGAHVAYETVDVRNPDSLRSCIRAVYDRYGRIDAVVHGAGILDDGLLATKSSESFDAVLDTKIVSLRIFEEDLRSDSLRYLLLLSSVSGRFGNPGQSDYAAANEILTRWAWKASRQWPQARVLAICWGPWAEIGMAAGAVSERLQQRGIFPIPPAEACRIVRSHLLHGTPDKCEIIAGEGFWRTPTANGNPAAAHL